MGSFLLINNFTWAAARPAYSLRFPTAKGSMTWARCSRVLGAHSPCVRRLDIRSTPQVISLQVHSVLNPVHVSIHSTVHSILF